MGKRKFGLGLSFLLAAGTILGACGGGDKEKDNGGNTEGQQSADDTFSVAMVTDEGGVDDKSFNQSAWEGIKQFGKDNNLEKGNGGYDYLQSTKAAEYIPNLNKLISRDFDLIFGIGAMVKDAVEDIASERPDNHFALVDEVTDMPNVASVMFKEQEGAFLAGVVAANMSKSGKVGFIGGRDLPVIKRFEAGFRAGAEAVNPDIKVEVHYTNDFTKADLGKAAANLMYSSGVDIIFHAAGGTGNGIFSEAKERKKQIRMNMFGSSVSILTNTMKEKSGTRA